MGFPLSGTAPPSRRRWRHIPALHRYLAVFSGCPLACLTVTVPTEPLRATLPESNRNRVSIPILGQRAESNCTLGTGGRLCSPNLRFWRPALSIELHPYIYRPQRRYAPGLFRLSGGLYVIRCAVLHSVLPLRFLNSLSSHFKISGV